MAPTARQLDRLPALGRDAAHAAVQLTQQGSSLKCLTRQWQSQTGARRKGRAKPPRRLHHSSIASGRCIQRAGDLGAVEGRHGAGIGGAQQGDRTTALSKPEQGEKESGAGGKDGWIHGRWPPRRGVELNFYVAPQGRFGPGWRGSLQYRRLYLARAMTGEFAAAWMPSVFVPLVGILAPAVAMALLFNVIEARD